MIYRNEIAELINLEYFDNESKSGYRYFKQVIAMKVYNSINKLSSVLSTFVSLSQIWAEIRLYFHLLNNPKHTCEEPNNWFEDFYGDKKIYCSFD